MGEKCLRFQYTYSESFSVEEFDNCVEAGAPVGSDG
jgi:hypothetical protein